jgi:hypothetical protein
MAISSGLRAGIAGLSDLWYLLGIRQLWYLLGLAKAQTVSL